MNENKKNSKRTIEEITNEVTRKVIDCSFSIDDINREMLGVTKRTSRQMDRMVNEITAEIDEKILAEIRFEDIKEKGTAILHTRSDNKALRKLCIDHLDKREES